MNSTAVAVKDPDSFAAMFEESLTRKEMRAGELITAQVVRVDHNMVVVNAGLKSESLIAIEEFLAAKGELEVKAGDFVTVAIEALENGYGETKLSREKAKRLAAWHDLELAMEEGRIVEGFVSGKVKGGLTAIVKGVVKNITDYGAFVDLGGIDGLLHITDLAWRRVKHPSEVLTVGYEIEAKILKFVQEKNRVSLGIKQMGD